MNSVLSAARTGLLFQWDSPKGRRLTIAMFLILSVIAHAFCFYVFQIVYPPTVALTPPPARVTLITAETEEGRSLLRWIESEDPALAFATHRPPEARFRALPKIEHVPSYLTRDPILKEAPPAVPSLRAPSIQPPGAVPIQRQPSAENLSGFATTATFSEELSKLGTPTLPPAKFTASNNEPAPNARFRVAATAGGEIRHCFLVETSGDPALDEQARNFLLLSRFQSDGGQQSTDDDSLVWGIATIEWGNDVARPASSPSANSSP
jgi:hypothetical protein